MIIVTYIIVTATAIMILTPKEKFGAVMIFLICFVPPLGGILFFIPIPYTIKFALLFGAVGTVHPFFCDWLEGRTIEEKEVEEYVYYSTSSLSSERRTFYELLSDRHKKKTPKE